MTRIEVVRATRCFHATRFEDTAPKTTAAVMQALSLWAPAVHAQLSGDMFRMFEPAPIPVEDTESGESF